MSFTRAVAVTGSNRGLGLEFITQLSEDPKTLAIALCRSDSEALDKLKAKGNVKVVMCDTGDDASVKAAAKEVAGLNGGKLDVLINNAAVNPGPQKVSEITDFKPLNDTLNININGPIRTINAFLPLLRAGKEKRIVNLSSGMGSITKTLQKVMSHAAEYSISKGCLDMVNAQYAIELDTDGFTTIVFDPGHVETDMGGKGAPLQPPESIRTMLGKINSLKTSDNGKFFAVSGNGKDIKAQEQAW